MIDDGPFLSIPPVNLQSPPSRFTPPVTRAAVPPPSEPEPEPEPEPEQHGDWAEALYNYESAVNGAHPLFPCMHTQVAYCLGIGRPRVEGRTKSLGD